MSVSTQDYASLAKDAYHNYSPADIDRKVVELNGHQYRVVDHTADPSGFHATAYQRVDTNEIVIAYRGTDPDHRLTTIQDAAVDAIMVTSAVNPQEHDADKFTARVMQKAANLGVPTDHVTVAGHSLGGTLAEVEAWRHGLHGQTFNAYGAASLGFGVPAGRGQVINNVLANDPVSAAASHFGSVRVYATQDDIQQLQQTGYLDRKGGFEAAWNGMRASDHSINNWAPDPGKGPSVLTAANEARAIHYAPAIDHLRSDIFKIREMAHLGAELGIPVFSDVRTVARVVEEATTDAVVVGRAAVKVGTAIEHGAERAGSAVKSGAIATGHQVSRAYDATVSGLQQGERAVTSGINATGQAVGEGFQSLEQRAIHLFGDDRAPPSPAGFRAGSRGEVPASSSATAAPPQVIMLDQPHHLDHAMYRQALHGVEQVDARMGRTSDARSAHLAGALTVTARQSGMTQIDDVRMSEDGLHDFAVQQHPQQAVFDQYSRVETGQAVHTTIAQSSAALQQVAQQEQARAAVIQAEPQQSPLHQGMAQGMGR